MTEKLFYADSYQQEFEGLVMSCKEEKDGFEILLDRTTFFPEGGGQAGDTGFLNDVLVFDTIEKKGVVIHKTKEPIEPGSKVNGRLDFAERFSKMQQHTGEHIVSGLIHDKLGYDNVGFHLGKDVVTMDFNGCITPQELKEIELSANQILIKNLPIQVSYPSEQELTALIYRSKIEIKEQVRIVTIPEVDACACCAPHVAKTGEIGLIKLTDVSRYKGGVRISMLCGFRALLDYNQKEEAVRELSVLFSAKPELVVEAAKRQKDENFEIKGRVMSFQNKYLKERMKDISAESQGTLLFEEDLDSTAMRDFVNQGMALSDGIWGCFVGDDETGYRYVLGSKEADVKALAGKIHEILPGKGGGKPQMVQGSVQGTRKDIEKIILS